MYIFYILNVIVSPLVHTPFSVGGLLVVDLTSLNKTFSGVFFFLRTYCIDVLKASCVSRRGSLIHIVRSLKRKIIHSVMCLGSPHPATPRLDQAAPGTGSSALSTFWSPKSQLVAGKASESVNKHHG